MKHLNHLLASTLLVAVFASGAGAAWLDTSGTGPEPSKAAYFCRSPFDFLGSKLNQYQTFSLDLEGQCGIIQDPEAYMPGWGGGGTDWKIVTVYGTFDYDDGNAKETVRHEGKIILDTTLNCVDKSNPGVKRNPWIHPYDTACSIVGTQTNNAGVAVAGPFPKTALYMETSAVIALRKWEADKDTPDPLENWDPMGTPPGYSALKVASPTAYQSIPEGAASLSLSLTGTPSAASAKVLMSWQQIRKLDQLQGDIVLPQETWDWFPFSGPAFATVGSFPLAVAVNGGAFAGKPGLYRVQVKLDGEAWWSPWRPFWIGPPQSGVPTGTQFEAASALRVKTLMKTKLPGGQARSLMPAGAAPLSGGGPGPAPALVKPQSAPGPAVKSSAETNIGKIAVAQASVAVESVGFKPAPLNAGRPVDVILTFKNNGFAASDPVLTYTLTCTVQSGGPDCPIPATTRPFGSAIDPGKILSTTLAGATAASAGDYELSVAIGNGRGRPFAFTVKPLLIKRTPELMKGAGAPAVVPMPAVVPAPAAVPKAPRRMETR